MRCGRLRCARKCSPRCGIWGEPFFGGVPFLGVELNRAEVTSDVVLVSTASVQHPGLRVWSSMSQMSGSPQLSERERERDRDGDGGGLDRTLGPWREKVSVPRTWEGSGGVKRAKTSINSNINTYMNADTNMAIRILILT